MGEIFELVEAQSGIKGGIFKVGASIFEAIFDGFADDKTANDGSGGDGEGRKMSELVDTLGGNRGSNIVISEAVLRDINSFFFG